MRIAHPMRAGLLAGILILLVGAAGPGRPYLTGQRLTVWFHCALGACLGRGQCARSGTPSSPPLLQTAPSRRGVLSTVFLIVLENHNWSSFAGNPSAPYLNHTLLPLASHASRYYNPPGIHPSLPNYLWLEAGTNCGIFDDGLPATHHLPTSRHLVTLLADAGISWRTYAEGITGTTCPLTGRYPYAPKHVPVLYFDDVTHANDLHAATCIAHVRPYAELSMDLRRNTVARYSFITPNLCNDGHDTCAPWYDPVKQTDLWLSRAVPPILSSPAYRRGGVLFITWDEGENGSDGPIGLLALSPFARGHGYASTRAYTHSALLRTVEEIFGVRPLLGDAAHAPDLRDLFTAFP
jgi:hypothetical protein